MADLTLERIAELRANHDKVRSFHGTHDLGGLAAAMHEWSRQLQMSSEALLAAAERGLTGGWDIRWRKNNRTVVFHVGMKYLIRLRTDAICVAEWKGQDWASRPGGWLYANDFVTHFCMIQEPEND